jgi:hypothetical protein
MWLFQGAKGALSVVKPPKVAGGERKEAPFFSASQLPIGTGRI